MTKAACLPPFEPDPSALPLVAPKSTNNSSVIIAAAVIMALAIILFMILDGRRRAMTAPATTAPRETPGGQIGSPPELVLPRVGYADRDVFDAPPRYRVEPLTPPGERTALRQPLSRVFQPRVTGSRSPVVYDTPAVAYPSPQDSYGPPNLQAAPSYSENQPREALRNEAEPEPNSGSKKDRVYAGRFTNPATTVPLGTVIPGVLETALDSSRPGAVRALVKRDVRGFDGSRILIPRGSRLYGEYGTEIAKGQSRALIRWTRLVRPDGALVALDSPASDPLGRAGVKGKVDSNFLERFGEALLQSTLDIGATLAGRSFAGSGVIVALPGGTPQAGTRTGNQVQRSVRVRHGTSVSVFVAHDLDFTPVES